MYLELVSKKVPILDLQGNKIEELELPSFFSYPVRKDREKGRYFLSKGNKRRVYSKDFDPCIR